MHALNSSSCLNPQAIIGQHLFIYKWKNQRISYGNKLQGGLQGITSHFGGAGRGFGDIGFPGAKGNFPFILSGVKPVQRADFAARKSRYRALQLIEKSTFFTHIDTISSLTHSLIKDYLSAAMKTISQPSRRKCNPCKIKRFSL
jgi:hypothetical protein